MDSSEATLLTVKKGDVSAIGLVGYIAPSSRENTSQSVSRLWSTKYTTYTTPTNRRLLAILAVVLLAIGSLIAAIGVVASIKRKEVR
ncbi:MAG: hypothetical protein ACOC3C_03455 [Candidatus Thorarchaeota archaeon]